jgi:uncharacterized protein YceK
MLTLWIVWAVLTILVISLAVFLKIAARNESSFVHLADSEVGSISQQTTVAHKLDKIDYWGKALTIVDVGFFAVLFGIVLFNAWRSSMELVK